jgi:hypothetical protein
MTTLPRRTRGRPRRYDARKRPRSITLTPDAWEFIAAAALHFQIADLSDSETLERLLRSHLLWPEWEARQTPRD